MWTEPSDVFGPVLPDARPDAALPAVTALSRVAALCGAALDLLDRVDATVGDPAAWSGAAAQAFSQRRAGLAARTDELGRVATVAGELLDGWARDGAAARAAMADAKGRVDAVVVQETAAQAGGHLVNPALTAEHDAASAQWAAAKARYWDGLTVTTQRARAVTGSVSQRPLSLGDHVEAFLSTVWQRGVVDSATLAWSVTGEAVVDRNAWWRTVSGLPGAAGSTVAAVVEDPVGYVADLVDAQAWRDGRFGEALGAAAAVGVPGPKGSRALRAVRPALQTVDQLLRRVDLALHEGEGFGHTLARHVDITDAQLEERLVTGTLPDGSLAPLSGQVSRFTDRMTAEAAVTGVLRLNESKLRAFAAGRGSSTLELVATAQKEVGVVTRWSAYGVPVQEPATDVVVRLARDRTRVFIRSAFVRVAGSEGATDVG